MTISSRFGTSTLHQRDPRSALFDSYTGDRNRTDSASSAGRSGSGYGYAGSGSGMSGGAGGEAGGSIGQVNGGFRAATPNSRYVLLLGRYCTGVVGRESGLCGRVGAEYEDACHVNRQKSRRSMERFGKTLI